MAQEKIAIYSGREVAGIRAAAQAAAEVLARLCDEVRPGISTLDIDRLAGQFIKETGGTSGSYHYHGYPGQICVSLNDEVVHGIGRADRIVMPGDLVKLDVVVTLNGYNGDTARTVCAGGCPAPLAESLMLATEEGLRAGIAAARDGNCVNDIGRAVERVARAAGFSTVRDMVGHGCGRHMHEPPEVPNYSVFGKTPRLRPGMVICIEPMVNAGHYAIALDPVDRWTTRTCDHSLSAHFEHQILITNNEPEILTAWPKTASN